MNETRSNDATQIITSVISPQPANEQTGAKTAERASALLQGYTGETLTEAQRAEISAGVLQGLDISTIVGAIVDGKSFLPSEAHHAVGKAQVVAKGTATVRTPNQIIMGIVRATGQDVSSQERHALATGQLTPGQIIEQKLRATDTRVLPRVPGETPPRRIAHHAGRPTHKHRK